MKSYQRIINSDAYFMSRCLELAKKGLGNTYPNPLVGCVIVHKNIIVSEGWHKKSGEKHAESEAIGLLLEILKKFPKKGEKIKFKKTQFIIEELNNRRIKRVKVKLL